MAIEFDGSNNTVDAAIALSSTDELGNATPSDGYGAPSTGSATAFVGQNVMKHGRTTALTTGTVDVVNVTINVGYDSGTARFVNQIAITPGGFSRGGDSGSLVVVNGGADDRKAVGLLFAGGRGYTFANPIGDVLDAFGVSIDGGSGGSTNSPPTITISSPSDGATFDSGASITFEGSASDEEDGDLTSSLTWTSSIDGEIESGGAFSATLSDGNHTITAEATDSHGATGTESVSITVGDQAGAVSVVSIEPNSVAAGSSVSVTITGSGFQPGANVTFENGAGPAPEASSIVFVDASELTATVTTKSGGPPRNRDWDVRVTNPDASSGVLAGGFTVTP